MMAAVLSLILSAQAASAVAANGFKSIAKEFAQAAQGRGIERVAVLPFMPADGGDSREGWNVSEKLVTQIVRQGGLQAVERALLQKLMDEHYLGRTGLIDPAALRKVGRIFPVDAIVAGTFLTRGNETVINARFISVETGVILAAEERTVERDWLKPSDVFSVPVPELAVTPPAMLNTDMRDLRDSLADTRCEDAPERVDRLERQILDLKARYWALRLKKGINMDDVRYNPGSTITDPLLKKEFYDRMKKWFAQNDIPDLGPDEVRRFVEADQKAFTLHQECGL